MYFNFVLVRIDGVMTPPDVEFRFLAIRDRSADGTLVEILVKQTCPEPVLLWLFGPAGCAPGG